MRITLIILVLLNVLAFASAQGWLGRAAAPGEPERLSNQLNPERIVLHTDTTPVPPQTAAIPPSPSPLAAATQAPAPTAEANTCVALSGLTEAQIGALHQNLQGEAPGLNIQHLSTTTPNAWWVRIPPNGGREGAERKAAELRALGIDDQFIVPDPGPNQFAISLGLFKSEAKAQQHLAYLQSKRVRSASITTRSVVVHRVEVSGPEGPLQDLLRANTVRQSGATTGPCPT